MHLFQHFSKALLVVIGLSTPVYADLVPPTAPIGASEELAPGDSLGYIPMPDSVAADWPLDAQFSPPRPGPSLLASWKGADKNAPDPPGFYNPVGSGNNGNNNGGNLQTGGNGNGNNGCGNGNGGPNGNKDCGKPPKPPVPDNGVPGPLPLLGLGSAFVFSRKLRNRIKLQG